ncbi:MAG: hypothetical protein WEC35_07625 [Nitrosopumilaceae archaeon]
MAKKIENPLIAGIPAKIYILCYINEESGYTLARKIYNIQEGIPPTARIYPWTKRMIEDGFLAKTEKGFISKSELLAKQVSGKLHGLGTMLNPSEKKQLKTMLDSVNFRNYVKIMYERFEPHYDVNFGDKKVEYIKEFDALDLICQTIGKIATLCLIQKRFSVKVLSASDEVIGQYVKSMGVNEKIDFDKVKEGTLAFNTIANEFIKLAENSLAKFSKLWPDSHNIIYSYYVSSFNQHKKEGKMK